MQKGSPIASHTLSQAQLADRRVYDTLKIKGVNKQIQVIHVFPAGILDITKKFIGIIRNVPPKLVL